MLVTTPRRMHTTEAARVVKEEDATTQLHLREASQTALVKPRTLDAVFFKFNKFVVDTVYTIISTLYANNEYARFFVLETVARVPYFAYLSVMHLRETFGKVGFCCPKSECSLVAYYVFLFLC